MKNIIKDYVKDLTAIDYSSVKLTPIPDENVSPNSNFYLVIRSQIVSPIVTPPPQVAAISKNNELIKESRHIKESELLKLAKNESRPYKYIYELVKIYARKNYDETYTNTDFLDDDEIPEIYIIGLGINPINQLTKEAIKIIENSDKVFCVSTMEELKELEKSYGKKFYDLATDSYKEDENRLEAYFHMATKIIENSLYETYTVLALYGHPTIFALPPYLIHRVAKLFNKKVKIVSGISAMDCLFSDLVVDPATNGLLMYEATELLLSRRLILPDVSMLIWQVGTIETSLYNNHENLPSRFKNIKDYLLDFYPSSHPIYAYSSNSIYNQKTTLIVFKLSEIENYASILGSGITLYIPPAYKRTNLNQEIANNLNNKEHLKKITKK